MWVFFINYVRFRKCTEWFLDIWQFKPDGNIIKLFFLRHWCSVKISWSVYSRLAFQTWLMFKLTLIDSLANISQEWNACKEKRTQSYLPEHRRRRKKSLIMLTTKCNQDAKINVIKTILALCFHFIPLYREHYLSLKARYPSLR